MSAAPVPERAPDPAELRRAVDEAAQLARVLTFTFLSVWLYLIITAAATTHRDLLVGRDVTLPVLGVGVPLHMFYALAPLLFLVLHGNLLLHLQTLARRIARFDAALERLGPAERAHQRTLLAPFPFVEWLARRGGSTVTSHVYGAINLLLYVVLPLGGLLFLQLRFLPYQSDLITGWHTLCLAADLVLVWAIWPSILRPGGDLGSSVRGLVRQPGRRLWGLVAAAVLSLAAVIAAGLMWADLHGGYRVSRLDLRDQVLVAREPGRESIVAYQEKDGDVRLGEARAYLELGTPLDLSNRSLRHADLRGARLFGARLGGADLRGASLARARLDGARLRGTKLDGAILTYADLTGADLTEASVRGADLAFARLRATDLTGTVFDGADLWGAELLFSYVCAPQDLDQRRREGEGPCPGPRFVASKLNGAVMVGVSMPRADLTGADLRYAQLQGSDFADAVVDGADLVGTNVWRARFDATASLPYPIRRALARNPMPPENARRMLADACRTIRADRFGKIRGNLVRLARETLDEIPSACRERMARADAQDTGPALPEVPPEETGEEAGQPLADTLPGLLSRLACQDPWRLEGVVRRMRDDWPGGRGPGMTAAPVQALAEACEDAAVCGYVRETARQIAASCAAQLLTLPPIDQAMIEVLARPETGS
jgi:uncharacterized protein YjbI with pentapeptide repeats